MLSIGQLAKQAQVSTRTLRFYESVGLLPKSVRGENNYRVYPSTLLEQVKRIRELQDLGFALEDIKTILNFSDAELKQRMLLKLQEMDIEAVEFQIRRERLMKLLSVSEKIETGEVLTETERNLYMENLKNEIFESIKPFYSDRSEEALTYWKRDTWLDVQPQAAEFLKAVKKCVEFAKSRNFVLGSARGSAPASLSFFGLGVSAVDPLKYELIPERLSSQTPFFHVDVEYERGQEFVDFCKQVNQSLSFGEIQAFKMPLIDIVQSTQKTLGQKIDFTAIDDNSDLVLKHFKDCDLEKIFQFDFSEEALVMNFEKFLPGYGDPQKIAENFKDQKTFSFRDVINITALYRPHTQEIVDRIELYKKAKSESFSYDFLSDSIKAWLNPNFGVVIYHEDLIKIISEASGWDYARSNALRRCLMINKKKPSVKESDLNWIQFKDIVSKQLADFVEEESKWSFCMPHAISFAHFTKQTAILKSLHKEVYYSEIQKFEQSKGFCWDDIGIRMKGVSLHQD